MAATAGQVPHPVEEEFVRLPRGANGRVDPAIKIRSTIVVASLLSLRERGHLERYLKNLPTMYHRTLLDCVPGTWLDMPIGVAHYRAAEAIGLAPNEQLEMGRGVAVRIQATILGTIARLAKTAGVTPWLGLEYQTRFWASTFVGGAPGVYKLGPKEARYEAHGIPELAELAYVRNGVRGMFLGAGAFFCNRLYVHEVASLTASRVIGFRIAWA